MSNTKAFIDYSLDDNGSAAREALYAEIHDRVMSHIENKKLELAGGMLTREENSNFDVSLKLEKVEAKINRLQEELSIMEEEGCEVSDYEEKKKKLKKAKKKLKKLKEACDGGDHPDEKEDEKLVKKMVKKTCLNKEEVEDEE